MSSVCCLLAFQEEISKEVQEIGIEGLNWSFQERGVSQSGCHLVSPRNLQDLSPVSEEGCTAATCDSRSPLVLPVLMSCNPLVPLFIT